MVREPDNGHAWICFSGARGLLKILPRDLIGRLSEFRESLALSLASYEYSVHKKEKLIRRFAPEVLNIKVLSTQEVLITLVFQLWNHSRDFGDLTPQCGHIL